MATSYTIFNKLFYLETLCAPVICDIHNFYYDCFIRSISIIEMATIIIP